MSDCQRSKMRKDYRSRMIGSHQHERRPTDFCRNADQLILSDSCSRRASCYAKRQSSPPPPIAKISPLISHEACLPSISKDLKKPRKAKRKWDSDDVHGTTARVAEEESEGGKVLLRSRAGKGLETGRQSLVHALESCPRDMSWPWLSSNEKNVGDAGVVSGAEYGQPPPPVFDDPKAGLTLGTAEGKNSEAVSEKVEVVSEETDLEEKAENNAKEKNNNGSASDGVYSGKRKLPTQGFTDAEVAAWIEERRKNFPTKKSVQEKLRKEKLKEESNGMSPKSIVPDMVGNSKRRKGGNQKSSKKITKTERTIHDVRGENPIPNGDEPTSQPKAALSALAAYGSEQSSSGSDQESDGEQREDVSPNEATRISGTPANSVKDRATESNVVQNSKKAKQRNRRARNQQRGGRGGSQRGKSRQQNLHEPPRRSRNIHRSLLEADIRREQNVLLQCIRYIVNNDFFSQQSLD